MLTGATWAPFVDAWFVIRIWKDPRMASREPGIAIHTHPHLSRMRTGSWAEGNTHQRSFTQ